LLFPVFFFFFFLFFFFFVADKKSPAAFQVLSVVIPQLSDHQQWISTFAERLPTKLLAAFKSALAVKGPLIECTTALIKCLGQGAGGPVKKLLASFVGTIFPVLIGLTLNVAVSRAAVECVIECAVRVAPTVAPKLASVHGTGEVLLWKHEDPSLGARMLAESVFLERGDSSWGSAVAFVFRSLSILSHRACPQGFFFLFFFFGFLKKKMCRVF
jgi:hypothetical protein